MASRRRLTLELQVDEQDLISGQLIDETGVCSAFTGWFGLAGAIDAVAPVGRDTAPVNERTTRPRPVDVGSRA